MGPDENTIESILAQSTSVRMDPDGDFAALPRLWPTGNPDGFILYDARDHNGQMLRQYEEYQYASKNGKALFKEERDRDIYDLMNEELEINVDELELDEIKKEIENATKIESKRKSRFKHVLDKIIGG